MLAVQRLTGIKINHYVQVDFTGFKTMVDAVGGVPICSTNPLRDSESGLRLDAGTSTLRGEQALAYVRARYGIGDGSDLGRIQRQQRFLGAMVRKATSTRLLVNPVALTRFLNAATKSLTLDRTTSFGDLKALADQLRDLDPKRVGFLTAPIANAAYNPPGFPAPPPGRGGSKVLLDDVAGRKLWDSIINDKPAPPKGAPKPSGPPTPSVLTVAPEDVTVRVLNGVGLDGLARKVGGELQSAGFRTLEPTNADRDRDHDGPVRAGAGGRRPDGGRRGAGGGAPADDRPGDDARPGGRRELHRRRHGRGRRPGHREDRGRAEEDPDQAGRPGDHRRRRPLHLTRSTPGRLGDHLDEPGDQKGRMLGAGLWYPGWSR